MFSKIIKRLSFILCIFFIACLAAFTFIEKYKGTAFAKEYLYYSHWFTAVCVCLLASGFCSFVLLQKKKNLLTILIHISLLIIALGYFFTVFTGVKGRIHLREGETKNAFITQKQQTHFFPFSISLQSLEIEHFNGTNAPKNYKSKVEISDGETLQVKTISLNSILSFRHYRFYQTSFDKDGKGTWFTVKYDPFGIFFTYFGYLLFGISMFVIFFRKNGRFKQLIKTALGKTALLILLLFFSLPAHSQPNTISKEQAAQMGKWQVLYNNRIMPLQTLAKDFTLKLTGTDHYNEFSAEQVFFGWIFFPQQWQAEPLIVLKNKELKKLLPIEKTISYIDMLLLENQSIIEKYCMKLERANKQNSLHKTVYEINEKLQLIHLLQNGELLRLFPYAVNGKTVWFSPSSILPNTLAEEEKHFIQGYFSVMHQAVIENNTETITDLTQILSDFQQKQGRKSLLSPQKVQIERLYNAIPFSAIAYRFNLILGIIGFVFLIYNRKKNIVEKIVLFSFSTSFIFLTFFICLRTCISGRIPLGNGYETLLFLSWITMLIAFLLHKKLPAFLPFGFLLSGFMLLVSNIMNPQIAPLMPVLLSPWLSIHVSVIMVSYAFLAFTFLNAIAALIYMKINNLRQAERITAFSQLFLYLGVFLLGIGIFTGAVWANRSWGDYWSWDPKEVWALITFMVYGLALHAPVFSFFSNKKHFHWYLIFAFACVLMTYFGVNYFLGGMHGYVD
ncbi:MAG: cytochrome c biogenesis protein CcsA [Lentimicrobiaceae bacterium]|nr:cytochrome c biogenesis protein CcsA [Lentimicrobiaceae bacterium]